jgi:hypothetical protein
MVACVFLRLRVFLFSKTFTASSGVTSATTGARLDSANHEEAAGTPSVLQFNDGRWQDVPAAARVLAALMDKLHTAGAQRRRGNLAVVRTMTEKDGCLMADFHAADRPSLPPVE